MTQIGIAKEIRLNFNEAGANIGFASVWLLCLDEHLYYLLAFVLNLNFSAFYSTPNAKPKTVSAYMASPLRLSKTHIQLLVILSEFNRQTFIQFFVCDIRNPIRKPISKCETEFLTQTLL